MKTKDFREKAHQLISKGQSDVALDWLYTNLNKRSPLHGKVLALKSKIRDTTSMYNSEIISYQDYSESSAKATQRLLNLLEILSEDDFNPLNKINIQQVITSYINIVLQIRHSGHELILKVPEEMMVLKFKNDLIGELEREHGLCFTLENGTRLASCLQKTNSVRLNDNWSFKQNNVKEEDVLFLIAYLWC